MAGAFAGLSPDQLKNVFDKFDKDNSGQVSRQELLDILTQLKDILDCDEDECKASTKYIMDKCNEVGSDDDKMSFDEFCKVLAE